MADKKISALTAASTPLAGTEVLPIVQSGATVKVATNDLTVQNIRSNATTGILQVTGPANASTRVVTVPDANFTAARTDAAQTFTGTQSFDQISTSSGTNNLTAGASTRFLLELTNTARNAGDEYAIRTYLGVNNSTSGYHLYSSTGGVVKATINGDGTFGSATNTYGSTSDLKLKQDIVDAGSQWNDVKSLKFKKYRYKSNPNGQLQLGVIAQDLEESSPGLVYETRDEDTEGNDLGTVTKNVKYSILYLKAVAALQEAIDRIEKLEADVAALKG
jgi:hypothetical protein